MHKLRKTLLARLGALLLLAVPWAAFAQELPYPPWMASSDSASTPRALTQVAAASEKYFDQRGRGPRGGYKHYRRWRWLAQQHLDAQGRLFNHGAAARAACAASPTAKSAVQWQSLGPTSFELAPASGFNGGLGRISDLAIGSSGAVFAATSTGGLWRQTPGAGWVPLTNQEIPVPVLSAVVLEPQVGSTPPVDDTIYILTGDGDARYAPSSGVLKSTDGGATWQAIGPDFDGQLVYGYDLAISRIGSQVVLFAATDRGVYRIQGSGAQWTKWELVQPPDTWGGYYEVVFHPTDPEVVYAAGVNEVYRSTEGGQKNTWASRLGAPSVDARRVALAVTPGAPDNLYALYGGSAGYQGLYVSSDRGETFQQRSNSPNILGYEPDGTSLLGSGLPWYALALAVSPTDPQRIRIGSQNIWESTDGGVNWQLSSYWDNRDRRFAGSFIHNDIHQIIDLGSILYVASDGGMSTSTDGGQTWQDQSTGLNITQIYRISSTPSDKDVVFFAAQDNGSSVLKGGVAIQQASYDGTAFLVDPSDARKMFIGYQHGGLFKSKARTGIMVDATPPLPLSSPMTASYVTPLVMDPQTNLYGCYVDLWRSSDGATTWANLSAGDTGGDLCSALAVTPGAIYVVKGTSWLDDQVKSARIWRRTDGGKWVDITSGLKVNWISDVAADPETSSKAWVSAAGYGVTNVYELTGQSPDLSWQPLPGLPQVPIYSLAYDDQKKVLYAGSQCGVYRYDRKAKSWSLDSSGMPRMQVMDLEIQQYGYGTRVLYAGTLAQGAWRLPL